MLADDLQAHADAGGGQRKRHRQPEFVELIAAAPLANPGCVIEFESASGNKNAPDWKSLLRAWRDAER